MAEATPELAFYYPGPMWHEADWVKNLILFFDGVALLVPEYMRDRPYFLDPALVTGLEEHGLLTVLEPETLVDKQATEALATAMTDIITSGALDPLAKDRTPFAELSYSRLGYMADSGLAEMIYEELKDRGLAAESQDGVSIPMHPLVRSLVLVLLAQILIRPGQERGLHLCPATDLPQIQNALVALLNLQSMKSAGHVVSFDFQMVGVDLAATPLGEVLAFRTEHRDEYRSYARNLRQFVKEVNDVPPEAQAAAFREREHEVEAAAKKLHDAANKAWKRPGAFGLGLAGAAWRAASGDMIGGLLALGPAVLSASLSSPVDVGAYSYLFSSQRRFPRPRARKRTGE